MTVLLARPFLNLLWLTVTWNLGKPVTDPRTKNETSSRSILWQCMAVAWNGTVRGASRNDLLKKQKVDSARAGRGTRTGIRTDSDVYNIVTYK